MVHVVWTALRLTPPLTVIKARASQLRQQFSTLFQHNSSQQNLAKQLRPPSSFLAIGWTVMFISTAEMMVPLTHWLAMTAQSQKAVTLCRSHILIVRMVLRVTAREQQIPMATSWILPLSQSLRIFLMVFTACATRLTGIALTQRVEQKMVTAFWKTVARFATS